jgi:hypothetical protein
MNGRTAQPQAKPWYREPWPWALMAAPAIAVIAGALTLALAVRGNDGVVADDYYKRGLAINQLLKRDQRARELGLAATVSFSGERVRVVLSGTAPGALQVRLVHPTRAGNDQIVQLRSVTPSLYEGELKRTDEERRLLVLEDLESTWRLTGTWARHAGSAVLAANP